MSGPRACFRIAEDYQPCGLLHGHPGPCVPFTPGDYLPPPILHPLAGVSLRRNRCPECSAWFSSVEAEYLTVFRVGSDWDWPSGETQLTFLPCMCVVRQIEVDG